jgi:predicted ATPase
VYDLHIFESGLQHLLLDKIMSTNLKLTNLKSIADIKLDLAKSMCFGPNPAGKSMIFQSLGVRMRTNLVYFV